MAPPEERRYRAGSSIDDLCRACKQVRTHTVVVADPSGSPVRVLCDYCGSQHNYRGGGTPAAASAGRTVPSGTVREGGPFPPVSERERRGPIMSLGDDDADLEMLLRRIVREEGGLTPVAPADKWHGGELILRPGREGLQEKTIPIETFFAKVVMLRNRLRVLEQQINASDLPDTAKIKLQGYITACYGSLTTFNVLFAEEDDRFKGSGGG